VLCQQEEVEKLQWQVNAVAPIIIFPPTFWSSLGSVSTWFTHWGPNSFRYRFFLLRLNDSILKHPHTLTRWVSARGWRGTSSISSISIIFKFNRRFTLNSVAIAARTCMHAHALGVTMIKASTINRSFRNRYDTDSLVGSIVL
jgi:hypothetical protein